MQIIGWAAMKISPRRLTARSPSTSSVSWTSTVCGLVAATRRTLLRWVSRLRIRSTARYRAVVCSQAAGLSGTPSCRHFSIAATNVSCASSSADGGRGWCNDPGLGCPVRADRGDHRVGVAQRGGENLVVWIGQVLPYDADVCGQLCRVPHHSRDR